MAHEIERKYLVRSDSKEWKAQAVGVEIRQGYLTAEKKTRTVRVRIMGDAAFIAIKTESRGADRNEWEFPIARSDAEEILELAAIPPLIEKIRHEIVFDGLTWCVDEFCGDNAGLVVAEVESGGDVEDDPQSWEPPLKPSWVGQDVTGLARYFNNRLTEIPYKDWRPEYRTRSDGTVSESQVAVESAR